MRERRKRHRTREGLPLNRGNETRIEGKYDGGYSGAEETGRGRGLCTRTDVS